MADAFEIESAGLPKFEAVGHMVAGSGLVVPEEVAGFGNILGQAALALGLVVLRRFAEQAEAVDIAGLKHAQH